MLTVASLLAAMTIAGAFWVGVLAARRLRDWGEGRRAIEEGEQPLALAAASSAPPDDERSQRVRDLVAQRLAGQRAGPQAVQPRALGGSEGAELGLWTLRAGDVVIIDSAEPESDGDYFVEGMVQLREGANRTAVVVMHDGPRKRWLVGSETDDTWLSVEPVSDHGLSGEPPRQIGRDGKRYALERRGQASAAALGRHGRPAGARAATYLYRASAREVVWIERWGDEVLMGVGRTVASHTVSFLPGS